MYRALRFFSTVFVVLLTGCSSLSNKPPAIAPECPEVGVVRKLADIKDYEGEIKPENLKLNARLRLSNHFCYVDGEDIYMKMAVRHDVTVGPKFKGGAPLKFFISVVESDGKIVTREDQEIAFDPINMDRQAAVDEYNIFIPKKEGKITGQVLLGFLPQ